jgi:hypothetical protein
MTDIILRQRGEPVVLPLREYQNRWADYLTLLERHHILNVKHAEQHILVYPNQYAGIARCPVGQIRIKARFPGLLAELRRLFPRHQRRTPPLTGYSPAESRVPGQDPVAIFLDRLSEVLESGFPFSYERRLVRTPTLSGSLDIGRTIREFDSLGIHHLSVVRQTRRNSHQNLAAVVNTIWRIIDEENLLAPQEANSLELLMQALPGLDSSITREDAMKLIDEVEEDLSQRTDVIVLCEAARDILSEVTSLDDLEYSAGDVSFSFTDSDALWERAVHMCMQEAAAKVGWHAQLHPMRNNKTPLYLDGGPDIDPDVIVYTDASPRLVVDAKDYSTYSPDAAGVYQVDSYARHLHVRDAALLYLSAAEGWGQSFGDSSVRIHAFGVPISEYEILMRLQIACSAIVAASQEGVDG